MRKGTKRAVVHKPVDESTRNAYTLMDVADLVLDQGYTIDYAVRKTGFEKERVERFIAFQEKLRERGPAAARVI